MSPMTVSADAALLLAQQHQQQQSEAAAVSAAESGMSAAAGISLDDGYMKDDGVASFMKLDDSSAAAAAQGSEFLKDTGGEEPMATGLTDSASGIDCNPCGDFSSLEFWSNRFVILGSHFGLADW